ncbi:hypothetical protein GGI35DRAFT_481766 [Trichoderma velutinum]
MHKKLRHEFQAVENQIYGIQLSLEALSDKLETMTEMVYATEEGLSNVREQLMHLEESRNGSSEVTG